MRAVFGETGAFIARASLIGGPGDASQRTSYWPWRFAHPSTPERAVLVPDAPEVPTQVADVRDVAAFLVDAGERPLEETLRDAAAWEDAREAQRGPSGERRAGLDDDIERELLRELAEESAVE